jgi:hypothetical protein
MKFSREARETVVGLYKSWLKEELELRREIVGMVGKAKVFKYKRREGVEEDKWE